MGTTSRPATTQQTTSLPPLPEVGEETDAIVVEAQPQSVVNQRCKEGTYRGHEIDCTRYYLCLFGQWQPKTCPNGTSWTGNQCDWKRNTKCHKPPALSKFSHICAELIKQCKLLTTTSIFQCCTLNSFVCLSDKYVPPNTGRGLRR